jgi:hypothetical protein
MGLSFDAVTDEDSDVVGWRRCGDYLAHPTTLLAATLRIDGVRWHLPAIWYRGGDPPPGETYHSPPVTVDVLKCSSHQALCTQLLGSNEETKDGTLTSTITLTMVATGPLYQAYEIRPVHALAATSSDGLVRTCTYLVLTCDGLDRVCRDIPLPCLQRRLVSSQSWL